MKTLLKMLICISILFSSSTIVYSWDFADQVKYDDYMVDIDDPHIKLWDIA